MRRRHGAAHEMLENNSLFWRFATTWRPHPNCPKAHLLGKTREAARRRPDDMRLNEAVRVSVLAVCLTSAAHAQTPPARPHAVQPAPAPAATWQRYPAAREVQLRDVAAIVRITPENRTDVAVAIVNDGPLQAPDVRVRGDRLVIDGQMRHQIRSC